jgi:hypothetical protein
LDSQILFTPIAGIAFAPLFYALAVLRTAELILVLRFLLPLALTLRFTLLAVRRLGAVALKTQITRIRFVELLAAEALALGRTLHERTQNFEPLLLQDYSLEAPGKTEQAARRQNKMNKSFVRSGRRKRTPSHPVFKPAILPDFQIGNGKRCKGR